MTLTEAAACGTPAVATAITGHIDAVTEGVSGLLVNEDHDMPNGMVRALDAMLSDQGLRRRLGAGAMARAEGLSWAATAKGTLIALASEASRTQRSVSTPAALGPPAPGVALSAAAPATGQPRE